jgi:hypothetical protein
MFFEYFELKGFLCGLVSLLSVLLRAHKINKWAGFCMIRLFKCFNFAIKEKFGNTPKWALEVECLK